MYCFLKLLPSGIQAFEPTICGCFISNLTPDPFLEVQSRLITGQVIQTESDMRLDENVYLFSSMPFGSINIQPDRIPPETSIEVPQTTYKSFPISLRTPYQTVLTQQRGNPTEDIKPLVMLARSGNPKSLPYLSPSYSQTWMQRKSCLVLKDNRLPGSQGPKFFLKPGEIAWPLPPVPEDTCSQPFLADTPIGASSSEPDEPSPLSPNGALDEPRGWDRPTGPGLTQTLTETSLNVLPNSFALLRLNEPGVQASLPVPKTLTPARSLCASINSSFAALNPRLWLSIPDADPPISVVKPLSLFQKQPPEFAESWPVNALGLLRYELTLTLGSS
jgi:hypothetical protein